MLLFGAKSEGNSFDILLSSDLPLPHIHFFFYKENSQVFYNADVRCEVIINNTLGDSVISFVTISQSFTGLAFLNLSFIPPASLEVFIFS